MTSEASPVSTSPGTEYPASNPASGHSSPQELSLSTIRAPPLMGGPESVSSITGTTAVIAIAATHAYYFINVGDSRSYLIQRRHKDVESLGGAQRVLEEEEAQTDDNGRVIPKLPPGLKVQATSEDHRGTKMSEAERVEAAGGYVVNGRINGKLSVSRAFGDFDLKPNILDPINNPIVCKPDIVVIKRETDHEVPSDNNPVTASGTLRRGTVQFSDTTEVPQPDTVAPDDANNTFEYDCLVVGCDGVWELQSIESIAVVIDERIQKLHLHNIKEHASLHTPDMIEMWKHQTEAALRDVVAEILGKCCASSCDQTGSSLGADNMSLGILLVRTHS